MQANSSLETIDLTHPVASREGIPPEYLAREQILFLSAQDRSLVQQTQFADAKAAALMTLMGLLVLRNPPAHSTTEIGAALEFVVLCATGLCLGACLWAVIPRYPNPAIRRAIARQDVYSWPGLTSDQFERDDYVKFMRASEHAHLVTSMARSNSAMSRILLRKFQLIRFAFLCGMVALVLIMLRGIAGI